MSLKYAILGWLSTGPGSGYDLARQLDQGLGWFWTAPHSQIYPRLRQMEEDGFITSHQETVGTKLEKRVYQITDAGREEIKKWTSEPPTYPPNRDAERIKLMFGDDGDLTALRQHFEAHYEHFKERQDTLRSFLKLVISRQHPRIEQRISNASDEPHKELTLAVREWAYRGDLQRAALEMEWAQDALNWLDAFEQRWNVTDGLLDQPEDPSNMPVSDNRDLASPSPQK